ncbi:MAG: sterol desaturase family protein [Bacteroidota bacterium]
MNHYVDIVLRSYQDYASYLWNDITHPQWNSYFYALIFVSLVFFILEVVIPWRKQQPILRKDFFLDAFYMFFNFFLFSLVAYNAASNVLVELVNDGIQYLFQGFDLQQSNPMYAWPLWAILLTGFVIRDFIQWWVHRLLHRVEFLWKFHQVHHSIEEMGFAGHLRFHWMETVVYRTVEYLPLALLGIGLYDFFIIHLFSLAWGHYNHANFRLRHWISGGIIGLLIGLAVGSSSSEIDVISTPNFLTTVLGGGLGFLFGAVALRPLMPYVFNGPEMHLYHHARVLPEDRHYGVNFGLTLAIWDYLFGTDYVPEKSGTIALGFDGMEEFPEDFVHQSLVGLPGVSKVGK